MHIFERLLFGGHGVGIHGAVGNIVRGGSVGSDRFLCRRWIYW